MIRRSPTRIELKLDDLHEFDYVQKCDKKKNAGNVATAGTSAQEAQRLQRHERIGYRSTRNNNVVSASGSTVLPATSSATASTGPAPVTPATGANAAQDDGNSPESSLAETVEAVSMNESDFDRSVSVRRESSAAAHSALDVEMSIDEDDMV